MGVFSALEIERLSDPQKYELARNTVDVCFSSPTMLCADYALFRFGVISGVREVAEHVAPSGERQHCCRRAGRSGPQCTDSADEGNLSTA